MVRGIGFVTVASFAIGRAALAQDTTQAGRPAATVIPHMRQGRILGIYDDKTGAPIAGAEVRDLNTGLSAVTTSTGTLSLFFVDTVTTLVSVRKLGYAPLTMMISNTARDTTPVTLTLETAISRLPAILTTAKASARGPADTIPALERSGFYARRHAGIGPDAAFVTADKLRGLLLLSDYAAKPICSANLYIDGAKVNVGGGPKNVLRTGIDALINVSDVAGMETYDLAEAPAEFSATFSGTSVMQGGSTGCVTMIWLNY